MAVELPPDVLERLRKIAGMLGSEHAGERATAAAKANELLSKYRATWADVLAPSAIAAPPEPDWQDVGVTIPRDIPDDSFTEMQLRACAKRAIAEHKAGHVNLGDVDFLEDVIGWTNWSPRQRGGIVRSLRRAWVFRRKAGFR